MIFTSNIEYIISKVVIPRYFVHNFFTHSKTVGIVNFLAKTSAGF